jgi:hypothetical protein
MADARSLTVRDSTGAPVTTGVTLAVYVDTTGAARTPPTITHVGAGKWVFTPSDADETVGTVALVDCGAGNQPRRESFAIHLPTNANQFWCFHFEDGAAALWSGAAPSSMQYIDPTGGARTPPSVVPVAGAYLYALTPTAGDVTAGIEGRLDAPAGAFPLYWGFSSVPVVADSGSPWEAPSPGPIRNAAFDIAQFLNGKTVGGQLLTLASNLFIGRMRDTDRAAAAPCVFVLNTGGEPPTPYLDDSRRAAYSSSVQVMVRGGTDDFALGEAIARGVIEWCNQRVLAGYVSWYSRDSQPGYLGDDGDQHPMWAINLDAEYDAALG